MSYNMYYNGTKLDTIKDDKELKEYLEARSILCTSMGFFVKAIEKNKLEVFDNNNKVGVYYAEDT